MVHLGSNRVLRGCPTFNSSNQKPVHHARPTVFKRLQWPAISKAFKPDFKGILGPVPKCGIFRISVIMAQSIIKAFHAIKAPHVSHMEILAIILQAVVSRLDHHTFLVHLLVMPLCCPVILCYMYHCLVGHLPTTKTYTSLLSWIILSAL